MNDDLKKIMEQLAQNIPQLKEGMSKAVEQFSEKQQKTLITGSAGVDAVSITINGVPEVCSVALSESFANYSLSEQQVLIKTALDDCLTKFKQQITSMFPS